ncbi:MAG TPA: ABC transporter permease, partial [Bacteroidales bacterium]|nr:ABC transporter permease [Bacteroidales bacterium]
MKKMLILPVRSVLKQGRQSLISVIGLSVAIASCILIMLYISYELSFDRYHKNTGSIFRVLTQLGAFNDKSNPRDVVTPAPLRDAMVSEIPGVVRSCRCKLVSATLEYNSTLFAEKGFLYADYDLLEMFTFPVLSGDPAAALKEPFSLFLTRSMALKYFGNQDPIGKSIKANNKYVYTVSGVLEDIPLNSHFNFDFLTGFETLCVVSGGRDKVERWSNFNYLTYVQLSENSDPDKIPDDLAGIADRHLPKAPLFKNMKWVLQPLNKIHLGGQNGFDTSVQSDIRYIFLVASIGIIIFLIACINYMNLATARSFSRGREIGILKVTGSSRTRIIFRLIAESLALSLGGLITGLGLVSLLLPVFADFMDRPLTYRMIFGDSMPFLIIALTVLMGVLAALLPSLSLSSFNPLRLIKEEFTDISGKRKSGFLKNVLLVIQYTISIVALVSALTMRSQLRYMKDKDHGFISRNILNIAIKDPDLRKNPGFLVNEIRNNAKISGVSASSLLPHSITSIGLGAWEGKPAESMTKVFRMAIDPEFLDFYNLQLVSGRGFSSQFRDDSLNNYIINETAARLLDRKDPVGMKFGFQK